jgi:hypothetical protein
MTHLCCERCRVRFDAAASAYLNQCPECGLPTTRVEELSALIGFRLVAGSGKPEVWSEAIAVSLPDPDQGGSRS